MVMNILGYEIALDVLTFILIITTAIGVIIYYKIFKVTKKEAEKPIIKKIIENTVDKNIDRLQGFYEYNSLTFPYSLKYRFFIYVDDEIFRRFSKRKRVMGWRIRRFNKFCNNLTRKIKNLENKAKEQKLIDKSKPELGHGWAISNNHTDIDEKDLLQKYGLLEDKEEIGENYKKLQHKSKKMVKKLSKIKDKWKDTYNIV